MTRDDRRLAADATGQRGAFTSQQARAAGMGSASLRSRVQSGSLEKIGVRTYRKTQFPSSAMADLHALILDVGDPVWTTGPTLCALYRADGYVLRPPFHLVTRRDRNVRRVGHVIHTTSVLEPQDLVRIDGIPALSPVRCVIEMARMLDIRSLTTLIDCGVRDRLFTESQVHRRAAQLRAKGRAGVGPLLDALAGVDATRGGHSWLEREFLDLLSRHGLPLPTMQVVLSRAGDRVIRVDGTDPGSPLVVELLGDRWHRTTAQMNRDAERANALVLDGFAPIQFTYRQIVETPDHVLGTMREAIRLLL